jgi:hypothetical protein
MTSGVLENRLQKVAITQGVIRSVGYTLVGRHSAPARVEKREVEVLSDSKIILVAELPRELAAQDITVKAANTFPFGPPHPNR